MQKQTKFVAAVVLALCGCTQMLSAQNYDSQERKQLFDYDWKFVLGDPAGAAAPTFADATWRTLDLPHDWSVEGRFDRAAPAGNDGGYLPTGTGWYRKTFNVPKDYTGKKIGLYFEGVYMNAEVFVNGRSVGKHPYGYTSFQLDISPYLTYGGRNTVAVRVDNSQQKNCRWYTGSGIYRHVWLTVTDALHIEPWGVAINTENVDDGTATVVMKTTVKNETAATQEFTLHARIFDTMKFGAIVPIPTSTSAIAYFQPAYQTEETITLAPQEVREISQRIEVKHPRLWRTKVPELYGSRVTIEQNKKLIDGVQTTFGIRTIAYSATDGLRLNGEPILLNGGCVHHDNGSLGAAAFDRAEIRKVELLKEAGFNAVRTSHNPPSEAFLAACDRLGLLVIDEAFDGWREQKTPHDYSTIFDACWQNDITSMVLRDRNHPSIFCWSIGNEIIERKKPEAVQTAQQLADLVRRLDPTRPVTSAMTTWDKDWDIFDPLFAVHDIGGYNYQLHRAPSDHQRVPSRMLMQTESYPRDAAANWKLVQENPYIFGDFVWTAIDYIGESGIGRYFYTGETRGEHYDRNQYPWHGAYCGDIDLTGWRKPISHYRDMLYNANREQLYMAVKEPDGYRGQICETLWSVWPTWESWTWPGHEGKDIQVDVCSRHSSVRLYLNGKLMGEEKTGREQAYRAIFTLPYTAGTLKAVGVENGNEVDSCTLQTADEPAAIRLTADRTNLTANGQDLAYFTAQVVDKNGRICPNATNSLTFSVSGAGTLLSTDNASLKDTTVYSSPVRNAWNGRAMAIVKAKRKAGSVKINVKADGLAGAQVALKVK